jgi:hypothetical protein
MLVIPAQAEIHFDLRENKNWIPACAGMTS